MIRQSKKDAILELKNTGMSLRKIARTLKVSRNTITKILKDPDEAAPHRESRHEEHVPLIRDLFKDAKEMPCEWRRTGKPPSDHDSLSKSDWIMRKHEIRSEKKTRGTYI
ncbi:conserved hypothetical protein, partial [delta proteobacterium NaphS2]